MAIATLIRTQAKMWGGHFEAGDAACTAQGFFMIYGGLSTFYWIMCIAVVMYTMIFSPFIWFKPNTINYVNRFSLAFNFVVPFLFAILPVITNDYAPTGGWCWISNLTATGKAFRWVCFYGQLVVILGFCIFAYCKIYIFLKFNQKACDLKDTHKMYNRIKYYPLCLIVGYSVATVRRFVELWDVHLGFGVAMATSVTTGLFGFFLLMVYGRLGKLNRLFKRKFPCCIPICEVRHKLFGSQSEDDASISKGTPRSRSVTVDSNSNVKHTAIPLSPPNERTNNMDGSGPGKLDLGVIGRKMAESKADILREVARFHSHETEDQDAGNQIVVERWLSEPIDCETDWSNRSRMSKESTLTGSEFE